MLIDSHAHVNVTQYGDDLDSVIKSAQKAGVEEIVNVGTSLEDSEQVINLAQKYPGLYATVGIHPNDDPSATVENIDWNKFENLAKQPKVVAIGECGLDYSRIMGNVLSIKEIDLEKERQKKLFIRQIEIAGKLHLPLTIHIRDAQEDLIEIFLQYSMNQYIDYCGVFHCFSGDRQYLEFILEKLPKFYISFAGNVTFRNAKNLLELASQVSLDRLLVETDCPFLSPEPFRGSRNEPSRVKYTAEKLAEIKNITFEEISQTTSSNAKKVFNL